MLVALIHVASALAGAKLRMGSTRWGLLTKFGCVMEVLPVRLGPSRPAQRQNLLKTRAPG